MSAPIEICSACKERAIFTQGNNHTRLLLVEGKDDWNFFVSLIQKLNIKNIWVEEYAGKENLNRTIQDFPSRSQEKETLRR